MTFDFGLVRAAGQAPALTPLDYFQPTQPQLEFLRWDVQNGVWRGGNQLGKTKGHAAHIVHMARGTHPWRSNLPPPPVEILLLGYSWLQMDKLLREIWDFLPKAEVHPKLRYEKGGGILGFSEPRIPFVAGPGKGSVIHLRTYKQGAESFMGMEVHYVGLDEPPPAGIIGEALGRTSTHDGEIRVSMTPTPTSPPRGIEELRKRAASGEFAELQTSLGIDACTPIGGIPWRTREAIERKIASWLPMERAMRQHGSWDVIREGRQFDAFDERHKTPIQLGYGEQLLLAVGIDHGIRPGRQAAVLCATDGKRVYFLKEYRPEGTTSSRQDGRALVRMLRDVREDLDPWGITYWVGDRAADSKSGRKDNGRLRRGMAEACDVDAERIPWLETPHKMADSWIQGCSLLNGMFREDMAYVDPVGCPQLIKSLEQWTGATKDPLKDLIDAARYAVEKLIERQEIPEPRAYLAA